MNDDKLWNEVCDIVQETGIKTIPMEKKCRITIEWETLESSSRKLERSGNCSCKDGHIKDRNGKILTEAEEMARIHKITMQNRS